MSLGNFDINSYYGLSGSATESSASSSEVSYAAQTCAYVAETRVGKWTVDKATNLGITAFRHVQQRSDEHLLKEFADILTDEEKGGFEKAWEWYNSTKDEAEEGYEKPKNFERIVTWIKSREHRNEIYGFLMSKASAPILKQIEEKDREGKDGLYELLAKYILKKGPETNASVKKEPNDYELLQERVLSPEGYRAFSEVGIGLWAQAMNGDFKLPDVAALDDGWKKLIKDKPGRKGMCEEIVKQVVDQLEVKEDVIEDKETKLALLDLTCYAVSTPQNEARDEDKMVTLAVTGSLKVVIDRHVFERMIGLSIATALNEAESMMDEQGDGWDLICSMVTEGCSAMTNTKNPDFQWEESRANHLLNTLLGEKFKKLKFIPPAIRSVIAPLLVPDSTLTLPLPFNGTPIAQKLLGDVLDPNIMMGQVDYLLGEALFETIDQMEKEGNVYDMITKQIKQKILGRTTDESNDKRSPQEQEMHDAIGEMAYNMLEKFAPKWHENLEVYEDRKEMFTKMVADMVVPSIEESLKGQLKEAGLSEKLTKENLFEWAWMKTTDSLKRQDEESHTEKALESLAKLEKIIEPLRKRTSLTAFLIGYVGHILYHITIGLVAFAVNALVKAYSKEKYKKTLWYKWAHRSDDVRRKRLARKDYKKLDKIFRSDKTWKHVYDATLHKRVIARQKTV